MRAAAWPPYGPPLHRGTGAACCAPTRARRRRLGTRAGGSTATLFLHSGGGETYDGRPPPGHATGRSVKARSGYVYRSWPGEEGECDSQHSTDCRP